ncbi:hypothetical protein FQN54_009214 [Arachnomyces sp. PD_36]|nr:hypothetical protein FQN54_009214 [Arachnomyces sp. PD_36]
MSEIPLSFATCSINSPQPWTNTLIDKLGAISSAGFKGIELAFPDLQSFATQFLKRDVAADNYDDLCMAAKAVGSICTAHGLEIMMLQPFSNFEGWPKGSAEREDAFNRAKGWIRIMEACGTDMLQVGSTDSPEDKISTNPKDIVSDLRELADILATHKMRLAYENWCWSTHAPSWKDVWGIVRQVDRDNVGLCLDTFQTAGSEWADPTNLSGLIEDEGSNDSETSEISLDKRFGESLQELASTVPAEKIYLLRISDAYRPEPSPLEKRDINDARPRARWSHAFRPLPYSGGYLPVESVTREVLRTGFRGWFSVEVFDGGPRGEGKGHNMRDFARKGKNSVDELIRKCLATQ